MAEGDPLDPVATLRRIAFLMERRLADSYRIKAYRGAVTALLGCAPGEVEERAAAGTLRDLPGIGAKTAAVVADCVAGRVPPTLAELEGRRAARERGRAGPGGAARRPAPALRLVRRRVADRGDGDDRDRARSRVRRPHRPLAAAAGGQRALGRAAHPADGGGRGGQRAPRRRGGFRLLHGIEVDILDDGALDQTDEMLGRLDVVVASVHSKLRMDRAAMTRRMVAAVHHPETNVLGHCTGRLVTGGRGTRPPSEFDPDAVFAACAEAGVAVEINSRPERSDPPDDLVALALDAGCLFSIDSDAHAPGQLDFLSYGAARAEQLGVPVDRIVNTWPMDRLLTWANG